MTKLKRVICLFACVIMTGAFLAGCALFERNVDYYNNLVVAKVGEHIRITKGQLVQAYNNFGNQYTQQGMSAKDAYGQTLEDLIEREILVELSVSEFSKHLTATQVSEMRGKNGTASLYYMALYGGEKADVRKQVFASLDSYYVQLQDKVREERKLAFNSPEGAEDPNLATTAPAMDAFVPFKPLVEREGEVNCTSTSHDANEPCDPGDPACHVLSPFTIDISAQLRECYIRTTPRTWSPNIDVDSEKVTRDVKSEALARLVRVLTNNERGMRVGTAEAAMVDDVKLDGREILTVAERAVIGREIGRMIEEQSKTVLVNRFQDVFDLGISAPIERCPWPDESVDQALHVCSDSLEYEVRLRAAVNAGGSETRAAKLAAEARALYRSQALSQYNRYMKGIDTIESLSTSVIDGVSGVSWLPTNIAENFFTVSHILIQYDDNQKAEFERIKSEFAEGGTISDINAYQTAMENLQRQLRAPIRDAEGKEIRDAQGNIMTSSAVEIRDELMTALGENLKQSIPQIDGTDKAILVPSQGSLAKSAQERITIFRDFIYRYNQDPGMMNAEFEYVMGIDQSKMVPEFTDASRELFGYVKIARKDSMGRPTFDTEGNPSYDWRRRDAVANGLHLIGCDGRVLGSKPCGECMKGNIRDVCRAVCENQRCYGCQDGFQPVRSSMTYDLVMTDFGAHIVMYTRKLSDFIYTGTSFNSAEMDGYLYASLNSYGKEFGRASFFTLTRTPSKTWFDLVVEKITSPSFDNKRNALVVNFKNERVGGEPEGKLVNPVKLYRGNFKDLYSN